LAYVTWQNRAFRFYLGARSLHRSGLYAPAAYTASMAIELILKATLVYWDRSFVPTEGGHGIAKLTRMVKNKASGKPGFEIPEYFYYEQRYLTATRYPSNGKGVLVPGSFIDDLDQVFAEVLLLVPFQHNTELRRSLAGRARESLLHLRRGNRQMRRLRAALGVKLQ
ncbi:MAG: HEPN domain-containing protein, partial [Alcaligenaceae bacterium]